MKTLLIALPFLLLGGVVGCTETTSPPERETTPPAPRSEVKSDEAKKSESNEVGELRDEFDTSAEAGYALKSHPDFILTEKTGWKIFNHRDGKTRWTFVPISHPAYPAVSRQVLVTINGQPTINGEILCEAADSACRKWNEELPALNAAMLKELVDGKTAAPTAKPK